jgi:hypothetical protein
MSGSLWIAIVVTILVGLAGGAYYGFHTARVVPAAVCTTLLFLGVLGSAIALDEWSNT